MKRKRKVPAIAGSKVRYRKITEALDLFDDGFTSAIWCRYCGKKERCLGVRYNGTGGFQSFPMRDYYPLWYIEPGFVTRSILLDLATAIKNDASVGNLANVMIAVEEFDARETPPPERPAPPAKAAIKRPPTTTLELPGVGSHEEAVSKISTLGKKFV